MSAQLSAPAVMPAACCHVPRHDRLLPSETVAQMNLSSRRYLSHGGLVQQQKSDQYVPGSNTSVSTDETCKKHGGHDPTTFAEL